MACCLSPGCCPGRRSTRRPATKSSARRSTARPGSSKSVASPPAAAETSSTVRSSSVVPDVVDRLRRRLCQDAASPCRCCQRCLGQDSAQSPAQQPGSELDQSPDHITTDARGLPPTPTTPAGGTTAEVADADFMTQFFRNCERIVVDNAPAIHEMLSTQDEERRNADDDDDDWTSNRTEPTSSSTVEQRRCVSHDQDVADDLRSGVELRRTDADAATSTSCEGSVERLIAPANSPVSAGSLLSSSVSDDVLPASTVTARCRCSPAASVKPADVVDDGPFVRRRPSVSGQSPAAVNSVNWTADKCVSCQSHFTLYPS